MTTNPKTPRTSRNLTDQPTTTAAPATPATGLTVAEPASVDADPDEPAPDDAAPDRPTAHLPIPLKRLTRNELVRLASDLRLACMRISRRVRYESDLLLPPHQFSVLSRLEDGPKTNSELAEIERVSAPSMKRTTNCLVEEGYVGRADDPSDGRQVILSLTPEGLKTLKRIRRHRDEWMLQRFEHLSEEELAVLVSARDLLMGVANE
jgi:DNA-binding MarR family transcriptional regulator